VVARLKNFKRPF